MIQELDPKKYFSKEGKLLFESVYLEMLKALFIKLTLQENTNIRIVIEARKIKGGVAASKNFNSQIKDYLKSIYKNMKIEFLVTPSTKDILLELADIVSNTFYKEYRADNTNFFKDLDIKLIQIKKPT